MPRIGRYHLFTSNDDHDSVPDLIVLDQNVCIHIGKFYFGLTRDYNDDLEEFLLAYPFSKLFSATHITSAYGIEENAWKRTGEFDGMNKRTFQWSTSQVLSWDPERVRYEFSQKKPPCERDKKWIAGVPIPQQDRHPLMAVLMSYPPLLRMCSLFDDASRRGGQYAFDQFVEWMMNDFGYLLSYEIALAAQIFLGKGNTANAARGILHCGGKEPADEIADKAWAAAWDMQYARLVDYGPMKIAEIPFRRFKRIAVVTDDKHPPKEKSRAHHIETIRGCSIYQMPSEVELKPSKFVTDMGYGVSLLQRTTPRGPDSDPFRALDTLERSMGVERRTITAFRQYPGDGVSSSLLELVKELDERK